MLAYSLFVTGWGWMGVVGSDEGVRQVVLPQSSAYHVHRIMRNDNGGLQDGTARFTDLCRRLKKFIGGEKVSFDDKLDTSKVTPFQLQVWEATRSIPWGETRTYGWVAEQVGRLGHCRAGGRGLAANPWPLMIPCHRVVGKSGCLTGYRGGLPLKQHLLDMERAE